MPFPILGAAAIGAGAGALSGLLKKKPKVDPYGGFTPEQSALSKTLGTNLNASLAGGPNYYSGMLSQPIGAGELNAVSDYNNFAQGGYNTINQLTNLDDGAFNQRFEEEISNPALRNFQNNILPGIEESLPSFSTARGQAVSRGYGELQDKLLSARFGARESAKDRALSAIGEGQNLGKSSLAVNAAPREIAQAGLDRQYADFVQGNKQYSENVGNALNFLGISSKTSTDAPPSILDQALAGAGAGAQIGGAMQSGNQLDQLIAQMKQGNLQQQHTRYEGGNPMSF